MTLQNRVLPTGEIVADPAHGLLMGNRGILHDNTRRLGIARWRHKNWVCCTLSFKGRKRRIMAPGRYTELFFLDEAVALAAGHRPCAECRRRDWLAFRDAIDPALRATDIDAMLHAARVTRTRRQIRHEAEADTLPAGCFVMHDGQPNLLRSADMLPYTPSGYLAARPRPVGPVTVLTPRPSVAALAAGYGPRLHPSADAPR